MSAKKLTPEARRSLAAHKANGTRGLLLPCPFCGQVGKVLRQPPSLPEIQKPYYQAGCPDNHRTRLCMAVPLCFGNTRAEAIAAWNTRAPALAPARPLVLRKHSVKDLPALPHTPKQTEHAFAACRQIKHAAADSRRHGNWDLNGLVAAERLALVALGEKEDLS